MWKSENEMIDKPNELPKGLISFAYNAIYNPVINTGARVDLIKEMSKFELSDEAKILIFEAQTNGTPNKENEDKLIELLTQELMTKFKIF